MTIVLSSSSSLISSSSSGDIKTTTNQSALSTTLSKTQSIINSQDGTESILTHVMSLNINPKKDWEFTLEWDLTGNSKLARAVKQERIGYPTWSPSQIIKIKLEWDEREQELSLDAFFNRITASAKLSSLMTSEEKVLLKGLAYSSLCSILNYMKTRGHVTNKTKMVLFAVPSKQKGKSIKGLELYYKKMGFKTTSRSKEEKTWEMESTVGKVRKNCKKHVENIKKISTKHVKKNT